ncbi:D-2-hydroxyacid dehydrogenase [Psychromarinibacter sp. C21-152]|uniref:D-2-hydroxyacid dehydrogenase n=1 Tax=Psychromarinibacter sediminicola TaxID=3033385 RepID=A0AAE3NWR8_9RHOB|nr:D-2-hydroxyacid dehydrogenase [Psychromarinibacter sediminicola]MDF0603649.1 D-2-hydroxyacid dehydrogenase [Psychromarinibacter sediminicola]
MPGPKTVLILDDHAGYYAEKLGAACPGYRFVPTTDADTALKHAGEAEVLLGLAPFIPERLVAAMPRLEWLAALTTGVDNLLTMKALGPEVALTNCSGMHGPQMSELAILLMLSLQRQFPRMLDNQNSARWEKWPQPILPGKTVCILGLGSIAEALAERCNAFGMRVTGVSDGRSEVPGFARVFRRAEMKQAAGEADFLVVLVPYSKETHHIVGEAVLAAMKPSAYLVNIARGGCVDEAALLRALEGQGIAGAGLDVFATEPLPPEDPLWRAPNCIITPHVGGLSATYHEQALPILVEKFNAYARGGAAALDTIPHGGNA